MLPCDNYDHNMICDRGLLHFSYLKAIINEIPSICQPKTQLVSSTSGYTYFLWRHRRHSLVFRHFFPHSFCLSLSLFGLVLLNKFVVLFVLVKFHPFHCLPSSMNNNTMKKWERSIWKTPSPFANCFWINLPKTVVRSTTKYIRIAVNFMLHVKCLRTQEGSRGEGTLAPKY